MSDRLVPLARALAARSVLGERVHRTPMLASATAARVLAATDGPAVAEGRLHLKAEHLQKTGSFKARGALARIAALSPPERAAGVVTLSAGNAAQAYAWAGAQFGVHVVVVMPSGAVRSKVDACLAYGAEVVLHGAHVGETFARMQELRDERGLVFAHPFDDPDVIAGVALAVKERRPDARVYGVEPEGSNALGLALAAGRVVPIQPVSIADGLGAPFAGEWTLAMARRYVDAVLVVDDATILGGLRFALERLKQVLEPAGAAALAAILFGRVPIRRGDRVCAILSGGNVEITRLGELIEAAGNPGSGEGS